MTGNSVKVGLFNATCHEKHQMNLEFRDTEPVLIKHLFLHESFLFLAISTARPSSECLSVCIVSQQILMSVRCPRRAPRERVPTQRVHSHVSSVSPVSASLRMDGSATVRLLMLVQECVMFVHLSSGVRAPSSFFQACQTLSQRHSCG